MFPYERSKAQQQQHPDDQQGVAYVFIVVCYQKIDQYQQQNGICIKFRQLDISAEQAFQPAKAFSAFRLLCSCDVFR